MEWDRDGDALALLQSSAQFVTIYEVSARKSTQVSLNQNNGSFLIWSKIGPLLAIGTVKGNLILYNKITRKRVPIMGKHSKKITCGSWNAEDKLALAGLDLMITISDADGNTLDQTMIKQEPIYLEFSEQKMDSYKKDPVVAGTSKSLFSKENTVSVNLSGKTVLLHRLNEPDNPIELAFQPKYGTITHYKWYGDGYMLIAFSEGYLVAISTHMEEIGEELQSLRVSEGALTDLKYSDVLNKCAVISENQLKIIDLNADFKPQTEVKIETTLYSQTDGKPCKIDWTADGQILSVATTCGVVFNYLMALPLLSSAYLSSIAFLSSLREICVVDINSLDTEPKARIPLAVEPSLLALGPDHLAVGMNTNAWFYEFDMSGSHKLLCEKHYVSSIKSICLNSKYAAVFINGKVLLHSIELNDTEDVLTFPEKEELQATSVSLTEDFLFFGTSDGSLYQYYIADMGFVNEFKPLDQQDVIRGGSIVSIIPNFRGTRLIYIDESQNGYVYSPIDDHRIPIPKLPSSAKQILWDYSTSDVFIVVDAPAGSFKNLITYVYSTQTIKNLHIQQVSNTRAAFSNFSVTSIWNGTVYGQAPNSDIQSFVLSSHDAINASTSHVKNPERIKTAILQLIALNRFQEAVPLAVSLKNKEVLSLLGSKILDQMETELAITVFRELQDVSMVSALKRIIGEEEKMWLSGYFCMLQGQFNEAQSFYLSSSRPLSALEMRRDLMQWEQALRLAQSLDPPQIPYLCTQFAQQLEFKGEYASALTYYQKALQSFQSNTIVESDFQRQATAGVAKMSLRLGDVVRGKELALASNDVVLIKDCAAILESLKQFSEAADLYVHAQAFEKAASIYISSRNFKAASQLMKKITSTKLHLQYGKAKEAEGNFAEAAEAYENGKDFDAVVRLNLNQLSNPQKAFAMVRVSRSTEGATLVAQYCQSTGNYSASIEFLVIAHALKEAFTIAQTHDAMDQFAQHIGEIGTEEHFNDIAIYFENRRQYIKAAEYYLLTSDLLRALKLLMLDGTDEAIQVAIQVIKKSVASEQFESMAILLRDYLLGDTDGRPKDPQHIFRLQMVLGHYVEAASTCVLIATQEQLAGNYKIAHTMLLEVHRELQRQQLKIPEELKSCLLLLHSYILTKRLVGLKDHSRAALLLLRVAKNISKFQSHIVPILTSTVIECQRAGLKQSCYAYACQLMTPEYRDQIPEAFKVKIEKTVRRAPTDEDKLAMSPCPFCEALISVDTLSCLSCTNMIPYCITTGQHMVANDWTHCPACNFPTLYSEFYSAISEEKICPMCEETIALDAIKRITMDPKNIVMF